MSFYHHCMIVMIAPPIALRVSSHCYALYYCLSYQYLLQYEHVRDQCHYTRYCDQMVNAMVSWWDCFTWHHRIQLTNVSHVWTAIVSCFLLVASLLMMLVMMVHPSHHPIWIYWYAMTNKLKGKRVVAVIAGVAYNLRFLLHIFPSESYSTIGWFNIRSWYRCHCINNSCCYLTLHCISTKRATHL